MTTKPAPLAERAHSNLATSAPRPLAERLGYDHQTLEFIRSEIANGAPDLQLEYFIRFCAAKQLDPTAREVYFIPRSDQGTRKWTVQTGIDGYRSLAERTGDYDGQDDPTFEYDAGGALISATVRVYRKGMSRGVSGTARWTEYAQFKDHQPTTMWKKMPHNQLAKCAEALALRKAFPRRLGAIYTTEEMAQAENILNVSPRVEVPGDTPRAAALRAQIDAAKKAPEPDPEPEHEISEFAAQLRGKSLEDIGALVAARARAVGVESDELRQIIEQMPGGKLTRGTAPMVLEILEAKREEAIEVEGVDDDDEISVSHPPDFAKMTPEQVGTSIADAAQEARMTSDMLSSVVKDFGGKLTRTNAAGVYARIKQIVRDTTEAVAGKAEERNPADNLDSDRLL